jgi:flagellar motor switch protein FliM
MIHVVDNVVADIQQMTDRQLDDVVHAIKMRRQQLTKQNIRKLMVGDIVSFESTRTGSTVTGKVCKVSRKYVNVFEIMGNSNTVWKVPANMLTPLHIGG